MITARVAEQWDLELDDLFVTVGHRFGRVELRRRMRDYVRGLLAPVARKNSWQLAEEAGHATPDGLQHLLAGAKWNPDDIRDDLQEYVADKLGKNDGVLIIDDTGFIKKGITSAGVQRQYSGTAGRTENCQIGVFAAYATALGRALVDRELYLPKTWTEDRERCRAAKVPDERVFATKGELARHIVLRSLASPLPIAWVTADAAYGQESRFRRLLEQSGVGYVLAVPKSQFTVGCPRIDGLFAQAPAEAWERISRGDMVAAAVIPPNSAEQFNRFTPLFKRFGDALLAIWRAETQLAHPTLTAAQCFFDDTGPDTVRLYDEPTYREGAPSPADRSPYIAFVVLWCAMYAFNQLLPDQPWSDELQRIADAGGIDDSVMEGAM